MSDTFEHTGSVGLADLSATVRFPDVPSSAAERSDLIDRAYGEYCERLEGGEDVDPEVFCARFPAFQTSLRRLVQAHKNLEENPALLRDLTVRWPESGESFLGYRLLSELGRGAFARVFLAQEVSLGGRLVAVKLSLHDDHEADTLGRLQHPNVVPVFSTQHDPGSGFTLVCMPFLGGTTMCHVIDHAAAAGQRLRTSSVLLEAARDARWPGDHAPQPNAVLTRGSYVDGALHLSERLASALAYVHDEGVIHRDLKPSNVLLCPNGVPLLLDFNLALDREVHEYRLGGTLPYMPPEQLELIEQRRGYRPASADVRTDLYGLGVIIFELLGRAHPYGPVPTKLSTLAARDWLLDRLKVGPRSMRDLNSEVDRRLADFAERCIARDPKDRPATAHELLEEIRWFQSLGRRARRWATANWKSVTAAGVLALVPAGAAGHYLATLPPITVRNARAGDELATEGKLEAAVAAYSKSLDADENQPEVRRARGRALMLLGKFENAAVDFELADPEQIDGQTLACQAYCNARIDRLKPAVECSDRAIAKGFKNAAVFSNLAHVQRMQGRYVEAVANANAALAIKDGLPEALLTRGLARWLMAERDKDLGLSQLALHDFQLALAGGSASPETYYKAAIAGATVLELESPRKNPDLKRQVNEWTRQAIERGFPRQKLEQCPKLGATAKSLPQSVVSTIPENSVSRNFLIDPFKFE